MPKTIRAARIWHDNRVGPGPASQQSRQSHTAGRRRPPPGACSPYPRINATGVRGRGGDCGSAPPTNPENTSRFPLDALVVVSIKAGL